MTRYGRELVGCDSHILACAATLPISESHRCCGCLHRAFALAWYRLIPDVGMGFCVPKTPFSRRSAVVWMRSVTIELVSGSLQVGT